MKKDDDFIDIKKFADPGAEEDIFQLEEREELVEQTLPGTTVHLSAKATSGRVKKRE